jgi:hypothetical protein
MMSPLKARRRSRLKAAFLRALALVVEYRRSYFVLNAVYYGLVAAGMLYAVINPDVQQWLLEQMKAGLKGPLAPVADAYASGLLPAIAMTFAVNLLGGSFASITLPSLVIPYSGMLIGGYRAVLWGLLFAPHTLDVNGRMVVRGSLLAVLILLEGQGYVLTMLAAHLQGKAFLSPVSVLAGSRWQGYQIGVRQSLRLYWFVAAALAVAAIYEAIIVVRVLPLL